MDIKTKLIMNFKTELDKKVSITVDSPRTDLTEEEINDAMLLILSKDIFKYYLKTYLILMELL